NRRRRLEERARGGRALRQDGIGHGGGKRGCLAVEKRRTHVDLPPIEYERLALAPSLFRECAEDAGPYLVEAFPVFPVEYTEPSRLLRERGPGATESGGRSDCRDAVNETSPSWPRHFHFSPSASSPAFARSCGDITTWNFTS